MEDSRTPVPDGVRACSTDVFRLFFGQAGNQAGLLCRAEALEDGHHVRRFLALPKNYLGVSSAAEPICVDIGNGHACHCVAIQFSKRSLHIGFTSLHGLEECAKVFGFHVRRLTEIDRGSDGQTV